MLKRILCFSAVAVMLWTVVAATEDKETFTADRHKKLGLECDVCHKEAKPKTAASAKACLACHESMAAVAERTKDFDKNPHKNHMTESSDVECTQCHQGHKADTVLCEQCHSGIKFEKMKAEAK